MNFAELVSWKILSAAESVLFDRLKIRLHGIEWRTCRLGAKSIEDGASVQRAEWADRSFEVTFPTDQKDKATAMPVTTHLASLCRFNLSGSCPVIFTIDQHTLELFTGYS